MSHGLSIPENDHEYFERLPEKVRSEIILWQDVIRAIIRAEKPMSEIRAQTHRMAGMRGFSRMNIIRKYYQIKNGGDWRRLMNHSKIGHKQESHSK